MDAVIEIDFAEPEGAGVYLRVVDSNRGHLYCLTSPEPDYAAQSGYQRNATDEKCSCAPIAGRNTESQRRSMPLETSSYPLPAQTSSPVEETQSERVARNLGVDALEKRCKAEAIEAKNRERWYQKQREQLEASGWKPSGTAAKRKQ
jgi:hypothetical protein